MACSVRGAAAAAAPPPSSADGAAREVEEPEDAEESGWDVGGVFGVMFCVRGWKEVGGGGVSGCEEEEKKKATATKAKARETSHSLYLNEVIQCVARQVAPGHLQHVRWTPRPSAVSGRAGQRSVADGRHRHKLASGRRREVHALGQHAHPGLVVVGNLLSLCADSVFHTPPPPRMYEQNNKSQAVPLPPRPAAPPQQHEEKECMRCKVWVPTEPRATHRGTSSTCTAMTRLMLHHEPRHSDSNATYDTPKQMFTSCGCVWGGGGEGGCAQLLPYPSLRLHTRLIASSSQTFPFGRVRGSRACVAVIDGW